MSTAGKNSAVSLFWSRLTVFSLSIHKSSKNQPNNKRSKCYYCKSFSYTKQIYRHMGGAISALPTAVETARNIKDVHLKQLPDAIEEAIFIHEKFPLIIDPTEQAARLSRFKII